MHFGLACTGPVSGFFPGRAAGDASVSRQLLGHTAGKSFLIEKFDVHALHRAQAF